MYSAAEPAGPPLQGPGCGFALWWAFASALGALVGLGLNAGAAVALATTPLLPPVQQFILAFISGLTLGTVQWMVLRDYLATLGWWEWALYTALSLGIVGFFSPALLSGLDLSTLTPPSTGTPSFTSPEVSPELIAAGQELLRRALAGMLLWGVLLGVAQWIVLRRYVRGAFWWVPTTLVGLPVGLVVGSVGGALVVACGGLGLTLLGRPDVASSGLGALVLGFGAGAVVEGGIAFVTGPILAWLLGRVYPLAPRR
jgi:hypothetical protein